MRPKGGNVIAASSAQLYEEALAVIHVLSPALDHALVKASKAAKNCSRMLSRSNRISWRASGMTASETPVAAAQNRRVASLSTTGRAPPQQRGWGPGKSLEALCGLMLAIELSAALSQEKVGPPTPRSGCSASVFVACGKRRWSLVRLLPGKF